MKLSLATNFDDALIEQVKPFPVKEIFGKLSSDIAGGGRASYQIVGIDRRRVRKHVELAHRHGIGFNYLLNAACLDNIEFTRGGQKALRSLLDWVCDIGCEAVTVSSPFLLRIVKSASQRAGCGVARRSRAQGEEWEDLGADCLMLDSILVNASSSC